MAYPFETIEANVRNNVNDVAADVEQEIDDAINYLSNFFNLKKIATGNTTIGQDYIAQPDNSLEIDRVTINGEEYKKTQLSDLAMAEDFELQKFYEYDDKIKITPTPTRAVAYIVWYKSGFTALTGDGDSDVPDRLIPLLVAIATWFYWSQILAQVSTERENFPDITPEEALKNAESWQKQASQLIKMIKKGG